jgi:hypothetical protein
MKNLLSFLPLLLFFVACSGSSAPDSDIQKLKAYQYAEEFVKKGLKSPASAKFPGANEKIEHIEYLGDSRYQVKSWVESQNSFGASLQTPFSCVIRFEGANVYSEALKIGN